MISNSSNRSLKDMKINSFQTGNWNKRVPMKIFVSVALEQRNGLVVVLKTTPRPVQNSKSRFGTTRKHSWILPNLRFQVIYQTDFINCKDPWLRLKLTIFNDTSFVVGTGGCHINLRCGQCRQRVTLWQILVCIVLLWIPPVWMLYPNQSFPKNAHISPRDVMSNGFCVALRSSETQVKIKIKVNTYLHHKLLLNIGDMHIGAIDNILYDISCWTSSCCSNILSDDDLSTVHAFDQVSPCVLSRRT